MAAGDLSYGGRTVLSNVSRIHSQADGTAWAFGELTASNSLVVNIHLAIPINASATSTAGIYTVFLLESQDGVEWTDNIDPSVSADIAGKLNDAKVMAVSSTLYDATNRTEARLHFSVDMLEAAQFIGFAVQNDSGISTPASGADGDHKTIKVS